MKIGCRHANANSNLDSLVTYLQKVGEVIKYESIKKLKGSGKEGTVHVGEAAGLNRV